MNLDLANPRVLLTIVALVVVGVFLNGLRLYMGADRLAGRFGKEPARVRRAGILAMVGAPLFFCVLALLLLGGVVDLSASEGAR